MSLELPPVAIDAGSPPWLAGDGRKETEGGVRPVFPLLIVSSKSPRWLVDDDRGLRAGSSPLRVESHCSNRVLKAAD